MYPKTGLWTAYETNAIDLGQKMMLLDFTIAVHGQPLLRKRRKHCRQNKGKQHQDRYRIFFAHQVNLFRLFKLYAAAR
jgi:hypothetical protein